MSIHLQEACVRIGEMILEVIGRVDLVCGEGVGCKLKMNVTNVERKRSEVCDRRDLEMEDKRVLQF